MKKLFYVSLIVFISLSLIGCNGEDMQGPSVTKLTITSNRIDESENIKDYYVGDSFKSSDIKVTATYDNGSESEITDYETSCIDGYELNESGKYSVTIEYDGIKGVYNFEVKDNIVFQAKVPKGGFRSTEYVTYTFNFNENNNPNNNFLLVDSVKSKFTWEKSEGAEPLKINFENKDNTHTCVFPEEIKDINSLATASKVSLEIDKIEVTCGNNRALTALKVTKPTKSEYLVEQTLDLDGLKVERIYSDGTTAETKYYTTDIKTGYKLTEIGKKTITVTEKGVSTTFDVDVLKAPLRSIEILTTPDKTTYIEGNNIDLTGLSIKATYENDTTRDISTDLTTDITSETVLETTHNKVTVSYTEDEITKSTTFDITVREKSLTGIEITNPVTKDPSTYIEDQKLDLSGLEITARYDNGTSEIVTEYSTNIDTTDPLKTTDTQVVISFGGKSTSFNITVAAKVLEKIEVTTSPKTDYISGQTLDLTEMVVKATYNNGCDPVEVTDYTLSISEETELETTDNKLTVSFNGKTADIPLTVVKNELSSIAVTKKPNKLSYKNQTSLVLEGMKITASYTNGKTADVTDDCTTDPSTSKVLSDSDGGNTQTVTVSYTEDGITKTATFNINVADVKSLAVTTMPNKTVYIEGNELDLDGMVVTATYSNDVQGVVTEYTTSPSTLALPTEGNTVEVTVSYGGVDTTFNVTVNRKTLTGITVTDPKKKDYIEGETLNLEGFKVTASYDNNIPQEITTGYTLNPLATAELELPASGNTQTITVTYEENSVEKTATFNVNVAKKKVAGVSVTGVKTDYIDGQTLDLSAMVVTVTYDNGKSETIGSDKYSVSLANGKTLSANDKLVVTYNSDYENKTTDANKKTVMTVIQKTLTDLEITTNPKKQYYINTNLDLSDMVVKATYNNGCGQVTLNNYDYTVSVNGTAVTGDYTLTSLGNDIPLVITHTYVGKETVTKTASVNLSVKNGIKSIDITKPTKVDDYLEGNALDLTGFKAVAKYYDKTEKTIYENNPANGCSLTIGNTAVSNGYIFKAADINTTDGTSTITVSYTDSTLNETGTGTLTLNVEPLCWSTLQSSNSSYHWLYQLTKVSGITSNKPTKFTKIKFEVVEARPDDAVNLNSCGNNCKVWGYVDGSTLVIRGSKRIIANADCSNMFYGFKAVTSIEGLSNLNTSNVTNMTGMFGGMCNTTSVTGLTSLDISSLDTKNVSEMTKMFYNNKALTTLALSENFSLAKTTEKMFYGCINLTTVKCPTENSTLLALLKGINSSKTWSYDSTNHQYTRTN